jgi:hypothetical protein
MRDAVSGNESMRACVTANDQDVIRYKPVWTIYRHNIHDGVVASTPYDVSSFEGNLLLNEGITTLMNLLTGSTSTIETPFNNANARLAVGNSSAAASAAQTDLQGTNKYKAMSATYPQISGQTVTFRAVFGSTEANFDWREFSVANGASGSAKNLNRKVSNQGTKVLSQSWTCDLAITFS